MDLHALEYYAGYSERTPHGHFHAVIPLHDAPHIEWKQAHSLSANLCRGWFELAKLPAKDRIEFTRDFWLAKLPYCPHLDEFISKFFSSIDDIGVFLTQQKYEDPFDVELVYSLAENSGFFHGACPASEAELIKLRKDFPEYILPLDYLAFLEIHNGFAKLSDTGILPSGKMRESYDGFVKMLESESEPIITSKGTSVNPASLIPFYESFGMPYYQCFWADWYPDQEMGNVYYSALTRTLSICKKRDDCIETMAFETFANWLMFYLEKID